jgi:rubredoxin
MAELYECSNCGWKGTGEEAMKPDKEIEEEWRKVWQFRKGLEDQFATGFYLGSIPWEKEMLDDLVCPRCAGEASRVEQDEAG